MPGNQASSEQAGCAARDTEGLRALGAALAATRPGALNGRAIASTNAPLRPAARTVLAVIYLGIGGIGWRERGERKKASKNEGQTKTRKQSNHRTANQAHSGTPRGMLPTGKENKKVERLAGPQKRVAVQERKTLARKLPVSHSPQRRQQNRKQHSPWSECPFLAAGEFCREKTENGKGELPDDEVNRRSLWWPLFAQQVRSALEAHFPGTYLSYVSCCGAPGGLRVRWGLSFSIGCAIFVFVFFPPLADHYGSQRRLHEGQ